MNGTAAQARIAELEAEVARLRAELAAVRRSKTAYAARRDLAIAEGTWQPFADLAAVRAHVRSVMDATGVTVDSYAKLAGVPWATVDGALSGANARVRTSTAEKLTAVTVETVLGDDYATVDATGARRRLQAITAQGWSMREFGRRSGVAYAVLGLVQSGQRARVAAATHRKIAAAYGRLADAVPPRGTRGEKTAFARARSAAERNGWPPPGAWDEELIDDPAAGPELSWLRAPEGRYRRSADLAAELRELTGFGLSREDAARRAGVSRAAAEKALERAGVPA